LAKKRNSTPAIHTRPITFEHEGVKHEGTYIVESGTVRVDYRGRSAGPTQIGASAEETARMLFRELLESQ
jgi:hypothetical protein